RLKDVFFLLFVLFLCFGFSCSSHLSLRTYHIITKGLTWEGAQQYCRENFQDLATFESMDDVNSITELYDWSWIGLHEYSKSWKTMSKDINSWRWSLTGEGSRTGYYKWMDSEPDNHMLMEHCGKNAYVHVSEVRSWYSALTYCRQHHIGFPVIENSDQQKLVHSAIPSYSDAPIWLGLYRVPWVWSDGSQSSYRNWKLYDWSWIGLHEYSKSWKTMSKDINSWRWSLTGEGSRTGYYKWRDSEPDNHMLMEHCVGMKPGGNWFDTSCQKEKRFVCYDVRSWYSALTYCRQHHIGFPVIENSDQQKLVHSAIPSYSDAPIWLGLYRVPWVWSDGSQSSYRNWSSSKSENYKDEKFCVSAKSNSEWSDFNSALLRLGWTNVHLQWKSGPSQQQSLTSPEYSPSC
uniref:C-type lectin domain-containing protein n=1 Tax=Takifugu rubripes TaxID=31033 RepID=A0A674NPX4_TAKRU